MLILLGLVFGCSRHEQAADSVSTPVVGLKLTEKEIESLRFEVREQTESLKEIADHLEMQIESGRQIDREILLRIGDQVSHAQSRVERIEALLDIIESNNEPTGQSNNR